MKWKLELTEELMGKVQEYFQEQARRVRGIAEGFRNHRMGEEKDARPYVVNGQVMDENQVTLLLFLCEEAYVGPFFAERNRPDGIKMIQGATRELVEFLMQFETEAPHPVDPEVANFIWSFEVQQPRVEVLLPAVSRNEIVSQSCAGPRGMCGG